MVEKLDKAVVLYMSEAELKAKGASCGTCTLIVKGTSDCAILRDPRVSLDKGVCGLYVGGKPSQLIPIARLSKSTAGYQESDDTPTKCGGCEYYHGDARNGPCRIVEGLVEFWGCCNAFEAK